MDAEPRCGGELYMAGGVEIMTRARFGWAKIFSCLGAWGNDTTIGWRFTNKTGRYVLSVFYGRDPAKI